MSDCVYQEKPIFNPPAKTLDLSSNGSYNVLGYDAVRVNVPGGGGAPVINPLNVSTNGTYSAPPGVDGYSPVTVAVPTYTGSTTITPTESTQTLSTANKIVTSNIVVNPIPSNYGKISWDGYKITVS